MKTCLFCKGHVKRKKIEHIYQWQGKRYLFKNVLSEICEQCGEVFLLPQSLKAMDESIRKPKKVKSEIRIPVFSLATS